MVAHGKWWTKFLQLNHYRADQLNRSSVPIYLFGCVNRISFAVAVVVVVVVVVAVSKEL